MKLKAIFIGLIAFLIFVILCVFGFKADFMVKKPNVNSPYLTITGNFKVPYNKIKWINDDMINRSYNYRIHTFSFMQDDLENYQKTKDKKYLKNL